MRLRRQRSRDPQQIRIRLNRNTDARDRIDSAFGVLHPACEGLWKVEETLVFVPLLKFAWTRINCIDF